MTTKNNPGDGPAESLYAVLDGDDGKPAMLEGRPAIFEAYEHAERARRRTSRPDRHTVQEVRLQPFAASIGGLGAQAAHASSTQLDVEA